MKLSKKHLIMMGRYALLAGVAAWFSGLLCFVLWNEDLLFWQAAIMYCFLSAAAATGLGTIVLACAILGLAVFILLDSQAWRTAREWLTGADL